MFELVVAISQWGTAGIDALLGESISFTAVGFYLFFFVPMAVPSPLAPRTYVSTGRGPAGRP